jgi:HEAT repeat protein
MPAAGEGERSDRERLVAVWEGSLSAQGVETTTSGLIAALESPRLDVRTGAAILLGGRGDVSVVPRLRSLVRDEFSVVRVEAAMSLALLGDRSGLPVLIEALSEEFITSAPITAAGYLAVLGDPRGYTTILKGLRSELAGIRLGAAVALKSFLPYQGGVIDGQRIDLLATLETSLDDSDPLVRRELLHKVALLDDAGALPLLSRIAESDPDDRLRQVARELLRARSGETCSQHPEAERHGQATGR